MHSTDQPPVYYAEKRIWNGFAVLLRLEGILGGRWFDWLWSQ